MKIDGVFEGGGIKGIVFVGVIECLEERGYEFDKVAGTSVGSLISALVACGYKAKELKEILYKFDFTKLNGKNALNQLPCVGKPLSLVVNKGVYQSSGIESFVEDLLEKKGKKTFKDVYENGEFKLKIITADVSKHKMVVIPDDLGDYGIDPMDFPIAKAVAMSAAIPFYFTPIKIKNSYFVDGGVVSTFPIWIFDKEIPRWPTLGFLIDEQDSKKYGKSFISFSQNILSTVLNRDVDIEIYSHDTKRIVKIPIKGIESTNFNLNVKEKNDLYLKGYNATRDFLKDFSFRNYKNSLTK